MAMAILVVLFFTLVFYPIKHIPFPESPGSILINNVNIIDVETDSILKVHHIFIANGIIEKISSEPKVPIDENVIIIDATDKFVISGLWDMHTHLTKQSPWIAYPEFVRHGVTHVRDMMGAYNERDPFSAVKGRLITWNEQVKSRQLVGPESHSYTSFPVEGPSGMFKNSPAYFNCSNSDEAIELVQYFQRQKIDVIKVYNNIPRDAFFQLMKSAKEAGIRVAGHKPVRVSTIEASNAGMKSMEHGRFFIWDSFEGSENLRNSPNPKSLENTLLRKKMLETHDPVKLEKMFEAFVRNNTWYCPTHLTRQMDALADDYVFRKKYEHINPMMKFISFEDLDATIHEDPTEEGRKVYMDFYLKSLEVSGQASKYGVKLLAGSDVPELPGSTLHEELMELSKAGLNSFEVLRTTTLYPAQYYGLEKQFGSVKIGKAADLVILSNNPIDDINNIGEINTIVNNGAVLDPTFLNQLKNEVAKRRKSIRMTFRLIWDMLIFMTM